MNGSKTIFGSLTIWGVVVMAIPQLAGYLGITVTAADSQAIVNAVDAIMTAGGALLAIWGRIRATKQVTLY